MQLQRLLQCRLSGRTEFIGTECPELGFHGRTKAFSLFGLTEIVSFGRIVEKRGVHEICNMQRPSPLLRYRTKKDEARTRLIGYLLNDPSYLLPRIRDVS